MLKIWPHGLMSLHKLSPHAEKYLKNISTQHTFLTTAYITTPHICSEKHVKMYLYIPNYFKHHLRKSMRINFSTLTVFKCRKEGKYYHYRFLRILKLRVQIVQKILGKWPEILNEKIFWEVQETAKQGFS